MSNLNFTYPYGIDFDPNKVHYYYPQFYGPSAVGIYNVESPRFLVPNKKVAVEPFPDQVKQIEVKGAVMKPLNQAELTRLKVLFSGGGYLAGQHVYVRTKVARSTTYAKEIFELEGGLKFILIEETDVVLVDNGEPSISVNQEKK